MSYSTVVIYMNGNHPSHSIFRETTIIGKSWLHDKKRSELLGWTDNNKVFQYNEIWDEENDVVIEDAQLIKECQTEDEAVEFAKQFFNVREIFTKDDKRVAV